MKTLTQLATAAAGLMALATAGCSSAELKMLFLNQLVGFATAVTSALTTTAITSVTGGI